jgi:hypothetical protein
MCYLKIILQVWIFANNFMNLLWLEIIDKFGCDHMELLIPFFNFCTASSNSELTPSYRHGLW